MSTVRLPPASFRARLVVNRGGTHGRTAGIVAAPDAIVSGNRPVAEEEQPMPVHDWTRVEAGVFHDFHNCWLADLRNRLNGSILPEGHYAMTEQHAGASIADILTLHPP